MVDDGRKRSEKTDEREYKLMTKMNINSIFIDNNLHTLNHIPY